MRTILVALIGLSGSGKKCFVNRHCFGEFRSALVDKEVGCVFTATTVEGEKETIAFGFRLFENMSDYERVKDAFSATLLFVSTGSREEQNLVIDYTRSVDDPIIILAKSDAPRPKDFYEMTALFKGETVPLSSRTCMNIEKPLALIAQNVLRSSYVTFRDIRD